MGSTLSAVRLRRRSWLGWMDNVTVAFAVSGMTVEAARNCMQNKW